VLIWFGDESRAGQKAALYIFAVQLMLGLPLFYLLTFAASLPAFFLLDPIVTDPGYIVDAGHDTRVLWACFLDFVNALACVGSAVAVFPVVRRVNESMALGFVMSRKVGAAVILIGVVALLTVVTLRQDFAGSAAADASALSTTGQARPSRASSRHPSPRHPPDRPAGFTDLPNPRLDGVGQVDLPTGGATNPTGHEPGQHRTTPTLTTCLCWARSCTCRCRGGRSCPVPGSRTGLWSSRARCPDSSSSRHQPDSARPPS